MNNLCRRLLAAVLVVAAPACGGESSAPKTPPPDARRVDPSTTGRISGRILFAGTAPAATPVDVAADPACAREGSGLLAEDVVVKSGGLANVFVYVKDGLRDYSFETPTEPVKVDQQRCRYQPHVFGAQTGQPIEVSNSDPTLHNVHAAASINRGFNYGQPVQGMKNTSSFDSAEVMVRFKCNVHPWMTAYAGILDHPYFAVTADGGAFELKNVPPGTYTIEAWHEKLGTQTQQVTVADDEHRELSFTFRAPTT